MRPGERGTRWAGSSWSTDERLQPRAGGRCWSQREGRCPRAAPTVSSPLPVLLTGGPILQKEVVCSLELALRNPNNQTHSLTLSLSALSLRR